MSCRSVTSRLSTTMLLVTNASGLLISCATPAAVWPRLASLRLLHHAALRLLQLLVGLSQRLMCIVQFAKSPCQLDVCLAERSGALLDLHVRAGRAPVAVLTRPARSACRPGRRSVPG